jgi:hypothetical protein
LYALKRLHLTFKRFCPIHTGVTAGLKEPALQIFMVTVINADSIIKLLNSSIFDDLIVVFGCKLLTLETVKCARGLILNALSHVEGLDQAFAVVNAAVLLANTHVLLNLRSHEFSFNLFG